MEREHEEEVCFEYMVVLCLRGVAVRSCVRRWRTFVIAVVDRCINAVCLHLSNRRLKHQHQGAKARTQTEKTRKAEDLLKEPPARCKRLERLLKDLS